MRADELVLRDTILAGRFSSPPPLTGIFAAQVTAVRQKERKRLKNPTCKQPHGDGLLNINIV